MGDETLVGACELETCQEYGMCGLIALVSKRVYELSEKLATGRSMSELAEQDLTKLPLRMQIELVVRLREMELDESAKIEGLMQDLQLDVYTDAIVAERYGCPQSDTVRSAFGMQTPDN